MDAGEGRWLRDLRSIAGTGGPCVAGRRVTAAVTRGLLRLVAADEGSLVPRRMLCWQGCTSGSSAGPRGGWGAALNSWKRSPKHQKAFPSIPKRKEFTCQERALCMEKNNWSFRLAWRRRAGFPGAVRPYEHQPWRVSRAVPGAAGSHAVGRAGRAGCSGGLCPAPARSSRANACCRLYPFVPPVNQRRERWGPPPWRRPRRYERGGSVSEVPGWLIGVAGFEFCSEYD